MAFDRWRGWADEPRGRRLAAVGCWALIVAGSVFIWVPLVLHGRMEEAEQQRWHWHYWALIASLVSIAFGVVLAYVSGLRGGSEPAPAEIGDGGDRG